MRLTEDVLATALDDTAADEVAEVAVKVLETAAAEASVEVELIEEEVETELDAGVGVATTGLDVGAGGGVLTGAGGAELGGAAGASWTVSCCCRLCVGSQSYPETVRILSSYQHLRRRSGLRARPLASYTLH